MSVLPLLLDLIAETDQQTEGAVWIPDKNERLGTAALARNQFADPDIHVVASQHGEDAYRRGWLRLDRTLTAGDHTALVDRAAYLGEYGSQRPGLPGQVRPGLGHLRRSSTESPQYPQLRRHRPHRTSRLTPLRLRANESVGAGRLGRRGAARCPRRARRLPRAAAHPTWSRHLLTSQCAKPRCVISVDALLPDRSSKRPEGSRLVNITLDPASVPRGHLSTNRGQVRSDRPSSE